MSKPFYTAKDILDLLAQKHSGDVFVPECKDGPTQMSTHLRLDALTVRRSWAHQCVTGYEIKVSRSDFLNDQKVPEYLPLCNEMYFVTPSKLVAPEEVPEGVGLIYVSTNGTRLYTKRKAPYRNVEIPDSLWRYIVICRMEVKDRDPQPRSKAESWKRWLAEKEEDRYIGDQVSRSLQKIVKERINAADDNVWNMKQQIQKYEHFKHVLDELGISTLRASEWTIHSQVTVALSKKPGMMLLERLRDARKAIDQFMAEMPKDLEERT